MKVQSSKTSKVVEGTFNTKRHLVDSFINTAETLLTGVLTQHCTQHCLAMSVEASLLHILLSQHFGSVIGDVGKCLFISGPSPLMFICQRTRRPIKDVKKSLMVLIQHQLVQVVLHPRGFLEYAINFDRVMTLIKYPLYISIAKRL